MIYHLPDYPWEIIKQFLLKKKHPTSKLIKDYAERYHRPQIFMSRFVKLRNGMYVKVEKPVIQIDPVLNLSFKTFVKIKSIR
jgi:hypothetical protein